MDADEKAIVAGRRAMYGEQDAWGNQVASLRRNLTLTPTERIVKLQEMYDFVLRFRGATWKQRSSRESSR